MLIIALCGSLIYYLQAYKIFTAKSAQDVTVSGFLITLFTSLNWVVYGTVKSDIPLICSGVLGLLGASLVLLGVFYYKIRATKQPKLNSLIPLTKS